MVCSITEIHKITLYLLKSTSFYLSQPKEVTVPCNQMILLKIYIFIYFGCAGSYLWHIGSLVAACELLAAAYGI